MEGPAEVFKKVLLIGDHGVGKTSLVRRFAHGSFSPQKSTTGADFTVKVIPQKNSNEHITLQFWDIAGQERYGKMTRIYFQSAVGALVVCDIMRPATFSSAIKWKQDLDSKVSLSSGKAVPALLLVNKCDIGELHKTKEEMDAFCTEHGFIGWYETSAKEDINVSTAFLRLVDAMLDEKIEGATPEDAMANGEAGSSTHSKGSVTLDCKKFAPKKQKPSSSCCGSSTTNKQSRV